MMVSIMNDGTYATIIEKNHGIELYIKFTQSKIPGGEK